ncbi:hypothetical protein F0562_003949 [Nyssa sinensis]|uniref:Alpha-mannosidase n=1 Tax=Nyssa sinensis TaxID=561372 RepID=A0A5J5C019_9ASTE|nr:hypothetical protein F0562_003949 [Nyssa sinensis]
MSDVRSSISTAFLLMCKYDTGSGIVEGKLNVHLVPHSHDDVGWLKTIDQYYVGSNNSIQGACVENVLDSVVMALLHDPNRKFVFAEMAFFQRWWEEQNVEIQEEVRKLVDAGQLEFINGGWCMHDEATCHYIDMIDQTTLGHHVIKNQFNKTPRAGWQIDPFGHSAVQAYLFGAELGFDSVHFARIDYQDRAKRKEDKSLEVIWRGSKTFGSSSQIFANAFPVHYSPPNGFHFEVSDDSTPIQDNPLIYDYNVEQRVNDFISAAITQANMDKFIHYVNKDGRVNALYSTPSIYTDAKNAANESWPLKTDDYFPYADSANAYWTGFFTSRPALKRYVRMLSGYYVAARQLEFLSGRRSTGSNTFSLGDALGIAQHHDAVTGTAKQHTTNDYAKRLAIGAFEAEAVVSSAISCLTNSTSSDLCATRPTPNLTFSQCPLLNISYCPPTEEDITEGKSLVVVAYNPLGWNRTDIIRIPVNDANLVVQDSIGVAGKGICRSGYFSAADYPQNETIEIGPGNLKMSFSLTSGQLKRMFNSKTGVDIPVQQSYLWYGSSGGDNTDPQASGAYIFRPNGSPPVIVSRSVPLKVIRGPLVDEVHQQFSSWIYQVIRLYKEKEHAEVEFTIGPIPTEDGVGKEVITRMTANMATDKVFYTDSNGRDFLKRVRDYRADWPLSVTQPVAGNYYPLNLGIFTTDTKSEFSVLVDCATGGASIEDGEIELMLHRRMIFDDSRGVGEALDETVCTESACEGLTVRGNYYMSINQLGAGSRWRRTIGQEVYSPLLLAFTHEKMEDWTASHSTKATAMDPNYTLPLNVALITLQELDDGSALLRFAHLYEAGEDAEYSTLAKVELKKIFSGKTITEVKEMSLSANQDKSEMKRMTWKVEGDNGGEPAGACVQNVLDSVVMSLLSDPNRKFIFAEMAFFQRWWENQNAEIQEEVRKLVDAGQLEFINGGWCMHDEATCHYIDMIDQTTLGHRLIKNQFNRSPRAGWQIDPFGHSAVQAYLFGAELGFDSVHFARIDYQDRAKRKEDKSLEVIWRGSKTFGSSSQIFANAFPVHYSPPTGFSFEVFDVVIPIQDNPLIYDYNVEQRVEDFISAAITQANVTRTNHIMWTMGDDFQYQYAESWFKQLDKLIHYVNKDCRVNALYSTPSIYTEAKNAANESWPLKTDDYFPYADAANAYWTGFYTSRPALKRYIRMLSGYYLAARQLEFLAGRRSTGPNTFSLGDALGIVQHHDAVTGTSPQHTTNDYAKRLAIGASEAEAAVKFSYLMSSQFKFK